ncbi:MAG: hypothetical protein AAGI23_18375 [Bacteroidota bacterium]
MMRLSHFGLLSIIISCLVACVQPPDFPDTPEIEYEGVNKTQIRQGSFGAIPDTLVVSFTYTDGDGNIGTPEDGEFLNNIIYIDNRIGLETKASVPNIPSEGVGSGISGTVEVSIPTANSGVCCIYDDKNRQDPCTPSTSFPTDTFTYTIYVFDQDGNESNRIETEPVVILCQ